MKLPHLYRCVSMIRPPGPLPVTAPSGRVQGPARRAETRRRSPDTGEIPAGSIARSSRSPAPLRAERPRPRNIHGGGDRASDPGDDRILARSTSSPRRGSAWGQERRGGSDLSAGRRRTLHDGGRSDRRPLPGRRHPIVYYPPGVSERHGCIGSASHHGWHRGHHHRGRVLVLLRPPSVTVTACGVRGDARRGCPGAASKRRGEVGLPSRSVRPEEHPSFFE